MAIAGDFNANVTQARLVEANRRYLRALYLEAMAAIKDRPHA